jgi:hypothetical protein
MTVSVRGDEEIAVTVGTVGSSVLYVASQHLVYDKRIVDRILAMSLMNGRLLCLGLDGVIA